MLPSGWVTFAFADLAGSTRWAQALGADYQPVLRQYRRLLGEIARAHGGVEVFTECESCFLAFPEAAAGLRAGWAAQRQLAAARWPVPSFQPRVRIGLHSGSALPQGGEYASLEVHRAARVTHAAHGGQVLCSSATAESARALPAGLRLQDLGLHRLRGFNGRERLFQLAGPDGWPQFPPPRTEAVASHNLPAALTSFVGRERERSALGSLLHDHPLVTVVGPAGLGKSRLAVEVAGDQVDRFPDGVWYVDLAGAEDPAAVARAVATTLGRPLLPGPRGWRVLTRFLSGRRLLLVLDGCAGRSEAVAQTIAGLLSVGRGVRVLATGREPVGLAHEVVWRLQPLTLAPPPNGEAVRLLADRVRIARGGAPPDPAELPDLARIAARLGGLPLSIERVAPRLRVLSARQLAARLDPVPAQVGATSPSRWAERVLPRTALESPTAVLPAGARLAVAG